MRASTSVLAAGLVSLLLAPARPAASEPAPRVTMLHGILRGIGVSPDGFFEWKPDVEAFSGVIGKFEGSTKEFEDIPIEVGGDRALWSAAQRAAYEAQRVKHDVERGQDVKVDLKGDIAVARVRRFSGDTVYACAAKTLGRTVIYARGSCEGKKEAAIVRIVSSVVAMAKPREDDVNGWLPAEVKIAWTTATPADLVVVDDGRFPEGSREAALKAVREAHAFAKRTLGATFLTPFPPVVRLTGSDDLIVHLSGKGAAVDPDANYLPWAGELFVTGHGLHVDPAAIARAATRQAIHHALGSVYAEPVTTGLSLLAEAAALGAPPGALLPRDEGRAYELVKAKKVRTWATILKATGTFVGWGKDDPDTRRLESELCLGYLVGSGGKFATASLAGWVAAMRKFGHPDAGAEGAYAPMDPAKSDAEFWQYWTERAEPPKKPGDKPPAPPPAPPKPPPKPKGK